MQREYRKELVSMYQESMELCEKFSKHTYETEFKKLFEKRKEELKALLFTIQETEENRREDMMRKIASSVPDYVKEQLDAVPGKRKRESQIINYNLAFVSFFIPLLLYSRDSELECLADMMIGQWNQMSAVTMKVGKATFEEINSGFRRRLCYVTTAVCGSLGKQDECYELKTLRSYRDGYLALSQDGQETIREYYNIAPTIVKRIGRLENPEEVYRHIWETYLKPCIFLIEHDRKEECREVYTKMVHDLAKEYLYS